MVTSGVTVLSLVSDLFCVALQSKLLERRRNAVVRTTEKDLDLAPLRKGIRYSLVTSLSKIEQVGSILLCAHRM